LDDLKSTNTRLYGHSINLICTKSAHLTSSKIYQIMPTF